MNKPINREREAFELRMKLLEANELIEQIHKKAEAARQNRIRILEKLDLIKYLENSKNIINTK